MSEPVSDNLTWSPSHVGPDQRRQVLGHGSLTLWFTGLSGSGKSTIANEVERRLVGDLGAAAYVLDGDNVRHGLNRDLGFAPEDRVENIRRVGEVCRLFVDSGVIVVTAFISPYQADRDQVRALHGPGQFVEVFVDAPIEVCEARDPKGLYRRARAGEIPEFSGISAPYEAPDAPDLHLRTGDDDLSMCVDAVLDHLYERGVVERP